MVALVAVCLLGPVPYAQAYKEYEEGRPLMVMVGASWCGPCQSMKAELNRLGEPYVYVDYDRDRKLASKVMVGGAVPQVAIYWYDEGTPKAQRWTGVRSAQFVRGVLARARAVIPFRKRVDKPWPLNLYEASEAQDAQQGPQRPIWPTPRTRWVFYGGDYGEPLRRHLEAEHGFAYEGLAGLTDDELRSLHSSAHENN